PFLAVSIDIKPGDPRNTIHLRSGGAVHAAIFSSLSFSASTVDPTTVKLAGASVDTQGNGRPVASFADVNRDGLLDLVLQFRARDLQLTSADTQAVLKGTTFSGQRIRGVDAVRIVP
ncbi:MAG: hypothetical protein ACREUU_16120, partial [Gammaproteobacteria bacterium]